MGPVNATGGPAPARKRPVAAMLLGVLAGIVAGFSLGFAVFGGLMSALPNGTATAAACRNSMLLGAGLSVAALLAGGAAWYVLITKRKALGWWMTFLRAATVVMALILLAPWPCGFTGAAAISFTACQNPYPAPAPGR